MSEKIHINEKDLLFDNPVEYKGLCFYPILVRNNIEFEFSIPVLLLDQYNDPDVNTNFSILQMPYLDYIFFYEEKEKGKGNYTFIIGMLVQLLSLALRKDFFNEDNSDEINLYTNEKGHYLLKINDISIDGNDFDVIKRIICEQNGIDLSIYDLDPQVRKNLQETERLKSKDNPDKDGSLEDKIISLSIETNMEEEKIFNMSIRKFKKYIKRVDHIIHYKIYTQASLSGFVKMEKHYPHWLADISENVASNVTSYDAVKNKINMANNDFDIK